MTDKISRRYEERTDDSRAMSNVPQGSLGIQYTFDTTIDPRVCKGPHNNLCDNWVTSQN